MKKSKDELKLWSTHLLKVAKIEWTEFNNGYHFKIGKIDFWPTTQKWIDTNYGIKGTGVEELISYIQTTKQKDRKNGICCPNCGAALEVTITERK